MAGAEEEEVEDERGEKEDEDVGEEDGGENSVPEMRYSYSCKYEVD